MKAGGFCAGSKEQPKQSMEVLEMAAVISFFLVAWLLSGTAFLNKCLQEETVSTAFHSPFSEPRQWGLAYPGWSRMLTWIYPWSDSYSANFETCRARCVLCALTFPWPFDSGALSRYYNYSLDGKQPPLYFLPCEQTHTCKRHMPAHIVSATWLLRSPFNDLLSVVYNFAKHPSSDSNSWSCVFLRWNLHRNSQQRHHSCFEGRIDKKTCSSAHVRQHLRLFLAALVPLPPFETMAGHLPLCQG